MKLALYVLALLVVVGVIVWLNAFEKPSLRERRPAVVSEEPGRSDEVDEEPLQKRERAAVSEDLRRLVQASNAFTIDLYAALSEET